MIGDEGKPPAERRRVSVGEPITTSQATRAVLRMIDSAILGDINKDPNPGYTFERVYRQREEGRIYDMLSSGERHLVDIAYGIWRAPADDGARIGSLGGLDKDNRRRVLVVLFYLHLGCDLNIEVTGREWADMFDDRPAARTADRP